MAEHASDEAPTPDAARAALHTLIDQLTDEALVVLWRVVCGRVQQRPGRSREPETS